MYSAQIEKLKKGIGSAATPDNMKSAMQKKLAELEIKQAEHLSNIQAEAKEKAAAQKKATPKAPKEKSAKKTKPAKKKATHKPSNEPEPKIKHKREKPQEVIDCENIIARFEARKESAKKSAHKSKTKPVVEKIGDKAEAIVHQVIEAIPQDKLHKDSKGVIRELKKIEDGFEQIFASMKSLLGNKANDAKVKAALKVIEKAIRDVQAEMFDKSKKKKS